MSRDCRRCGAPTQSDVAGTSTGGLVEVLVCRCGWEEPAPVTRWTREEIGQRIAIVRAMRMADAEPVGRLELGEVEGAGVL